MLPRRSCCVLWGWLLLCLLLAACAPAAPPALPTLAVLPLPSLVSAPTTVPPTMTAAPVPARTATATPSSTVTATATVTATVTASATLTATATASATATATATATPDCPADARVSLQFEGIYALMLELREPVRQALYAAPALPPCRRWTVSAYRDAGAWAKITLVPAELVAAGWQQVEDYADAFVEVVAYRHADGRWQAAMVNGGAPAALPQPIPPEFMAVGAAPPPLAGGYRFPWRSGDTWWAIQGWHSGSALDFQPAPGARYGVLAAESGLLREICSDGRQSLLQIRHADGRATYYLHVRLALSVRRALLDQPVPRGQYLGELIDRAQFVTPCGRGYSRHLHFIVSDRALVVEGVPLEDIAAVATCCAAPPRYLSSNVRVDAQPR